MMTAQHSARLVGMVFLSTVASAVGVPGAGAQENPPRRILPASTSTPSESRSLNGLPAPPVFAGLAVDGFRGDSTGVRVSRLLPALEALPGELRSVDSLPVVIGPVSSRNRPTLESLLQKLRSLPGGEEALQEARRNGARVQRPEDGEPEFGLGASAALELSSFADLAEAPPDFAISLTPGQPSSSDPFGNLVFYGAMAGTGYTNASWTLLYNVDWASSSGSQIVRSMAYVRVRVPEDGWYVVNVEAHLCPGSTAPTATLQHHSGGWTVQGSWDYSERECGMHSFPVVVELAEGLHFFNWGRGTSGSWAYFYEVDIYSL